MKYLNTKKNSLEEAIVKTVTEGKKGFMYAAYMAKMNGEKKFTFAGKEYDVESVKFEGKIECPKCNGEGCDHCDGKGYHMTEAKITKKEVAELEKNNQHGELALKLAMSYGTPKEVKKIQDINKRHDKAGSIDPKDQKERDAISKKYYKMVETIDEQPRQLKDPKKEVMVVKNNNVIVIDKKDLASYKKKGYEVAEDNSNDVSDDGDGMDKVQPKALKKKFKDRKDKDIDNDGDVDDSDEYLHKRRKTVSKAIAKESALISKAAEYLSKMWKESSVKKEEENDDEKEVKKNGKTMTGKPMSNIEVNPKDESKHK